MLSQRKKLSTIEITHYLILVQADEQHQAILLFQNNKQSNQLSRFESEKLFQFKSRELRSDIISF